MQEYLITDRKTYNNSENNQRLPFGVGVEDLYEEYMARRTFWRTCIVKLRMFWADIRGHHGKVWDYEPGDYYMGSHKGHKKHLRK